LDDITLKVELVPSYKGDVSAIEQKLVQQLRLRTNLRYNLEFHDWGTLPRYTLKSRRFRDLRKGG
jgi:phenylacetate-CoA ligase